MDLNTTEQKVAYLIQKVPVTSKNYKLLLLLYWQVFDKINIPSEIMNDILEKGTEPESIGRLKRKAIDDNANSKKLLNDLKNILDIKGE